MRVSLFYIFIFLSSSIFAQNLDLSKNNALKIPQELRQINIVEDSEEDKDLGLKIEPQSPEDISKAPDNSDVSLKEQSHKFSMFSNKNLKDSGDIFEQRYIDRSREQGLLPTKMSDYLLGEYKNNGKYVNIVFRDFGEVDGDYVKVIVNDKVKAESVMLEYNFKTIDVNLLPGRNKIEFLALNQGEQGPNTAELKIFDDQNNLISSKQWSLLTGVKAVIIFNKDEIIIEER